MAFNESLLQNMGGNNLGLEQYRHAPPNVTLLSVTPYIITLVIPNEIS
jgi:hypothetical protein